MFGELYDERRDVVRKDNVLVVKGTASVDNYSGGVRLSADELFDIEQARSNLARKMNLTLHANKMQPDMVSRIREIIQPSNEGGCHVSFEYISDSGSCELNVPGDWLIKPTRVMLEQLENLIGQESIKIYY